MVTEIGRDELRQKLGHERRDLFDGNPQPLAAFIPPHSHIFFLRERDALIEPWKASA